MIRPASTLTALAAAHYSGALQRRTTAAHYKVIVSFDQPLRNSVLWWLELAKSIW